MKNIIGLAVATCICFLVSAPLSFVLYIIALNLIPCCDSPLVDIYFYYPLLVLVITVLLLIVVRNYKNKK